MQRRSANTAGWRRDALKRGQMPTVAAFDALGPRRKPISRRWMDGPGLGETTHTEDLQPSLYPKNLPAIGRRRPEAHCSRHMRAYSIAVDNEARAFAFFAYLAASAGDTRIARGAEHLALEKLQHAAQLRTLRRGAGTARTRYRETANTGVAYCVGRGARRTIIAEHEEDRPLPWDRGRSVARLAGC